MNTSLEERLPACARCNDGRWVHVDGTYLPCPECNTGTQESLPVRKRTQRGFVVYEDGIQTSYGDVVEVQESSAAFVPHVWLRIRGTAHLTAEPVDHAGVPCGIADGNMAAHLNVEQAEAVRDALTEWINDAKEGRTSA